MRLCFRFNIWILRSCNGIGGGTGNPSFTIGDYTVSSKGVIAIDEHAIFDARDITVIYDEVSTGKNNVATAITAKGGTVTPTGLGGIYKFSDLVDGVNSAYTAGQNNVWTSIQNAASAKGKTGETLAAYQSANSVDSLYSAIDADIISSKEQTIAEVKAEPESYGIMAGARFLASFTNKHTELYMSYFGISRSEYQNYTASDFVIATGNYEVFVGTLDGYNGKAGLTTSIDYNPTNGKVTCNVAPWGSMSDGNYYAEGSPTCYLFLVPGGVDG